MKNMGRLRNRGDPERGGFTLVELLVVIAILSILLAILFPTYSRVKRMATAVACPIAYIAEDRTVWVCDTTGSHQLKVSDREINEAFLAWSPEGTKLTFRAAAGTVIVDPSTSRTAIVGDLENAVWVSRDKLLGNRYVGSDGRNDLYRVSTVTGQATLWKQRKAMRLPYGQTWCHYAPLQVQGFVVAEADVIWLPTSDVVLRSDTWASRRTIWEDPGNNIEDFNARVDDLGEYIAWTRARQARIGGPWYVAVKRVNDGPSVPPTILGADFESLSFCDWTPEGQLLVVVTRGGKPELAIMDKGGHLIQTIPTGKGLLDNPGRIAAWRRCQLW